MTMAVPSLAIKVAMLGFIAAGTSAASAAETVEQFYKGKQVVLITGTRAGSGNDVWARLILRHMQRHIPGQPSIIIQSMPGAGSITAANHLYNIAPKDGSVFGVISRNLVTQAILKRPNIKYDPRQFKWIGSPELENRVCIASASSPVKTVEDLLKQELIVGGTGAGTMPTFLPRVLNEFAGTKFKVVDGYPASNDVLLAMERREVDGICVTYGLFKGPHSDLIKNKKVNVLFNSEPSKFTQLPNVPSIFDYIKDEESKQKLNFLIYSIQLGRPFVAPPGIPDDRLDALRSAFAKTMKDPQFLAEAEKQGFDVTYQSGQQLEALVQRAYATPQKVVDQVQGMIPEGGGD
jgi:tripartite-type tricarboxylate transporter receptor subunit TctC